MVNVEKILSGGDDEDEDEAESDSNDDHEGDTIEADLDRNHMGVNLDEDDVLTGDDERDLDEDYLQQQQNQLQQVQQQLNSDTPQRTEGSLMDRLLELGQRHAQTPSRPNRTSNDQPPPRLTRQPQLLHQMQQRRTANSIPGFGMDYPTPSRSNIPSTTPSRPNSLYPNMSHPQREREYDEYEDGGDEMEE
ncbi:hypothetical protein BGZ80_007954 [Entomortierella chlamydospora]|uniref:Uncharacterized protein n=1 Tax=Entomortierella chlamydospora TaxID=101097 RepID=A0A9P6MXY7_9FUNG|nr:hypothetical protein BGZ80_007954 [Entomortierella chlamydospora]